MFYIKPYQQTFSYIDSSLTLPSVFESCQGKFFSGRVSHHYIDHDTRFCLSLPSKLDLVSTLYHRRMNDLRKIHCFLLFIYGSPKIYLSP